MKKQLKYIILSIIILFTLTGCGYLNPSKVTKRYVVKKFKQQLKPYGSKYTFMITNFNKESENREANGIVSFQDSLNVTCNISGQISYDSFLESGPIGSSYHTKDDCDIEILKKATKELEKKKYNFEIGEKANYNEIANNIREYAKELQTILSPYKNHNSFKKYFYEDHSYVEVPLTLNGATLPYERLYIEKSSGLVIIDHQGELTIEEYLQLLATGELQNKIHEIYNKHSEHK